MFTVPDRGRSYLKLSRKEFYDAKTRRGWTQEEMLAEWKNIMTDSSFLLDIKPMQVKVWIPKDVLDEPPPCRHPTVLMTEDEFIEKMQLKGVTSQAAKRSWDGFLALGHSKIYLQEKRDAKILMDTVNNSPVAKRQCHMHRAGAGRRSQVMALLAAPHAPEDHEGDEFADTPQTQTDSQIDTSPNASSEDHEGDEFADAPQTQTDSQIDMSLNASSKNASNTSPSSVTASPPWSPMLSPSSPSSSPSLDGFPGLWNECRD